MKIDKKAYQDEQKNNPLEETMVYIQDGNMVADLTREPQNAVLKMPEFYNSFKNLPKISNGGSKPVLATAAWLQSFKRKTARGCRFAPGKDIIHEAEGEKWFNSFHMPSWEQPDDYEKVNILFDHLERLIPNDVERQLFINWIACTIHRPEIRPSFTPLLISHYHGTGRGWIVKMLQELLGPWNCTHTKMKTLAGQGNDGQYHNYLHNSLFCSIPEVRVDKNRYDIDDEIRDRLTDSPLNLNLKYGANGNYEIFTNFLLASNHRDPLVITKEDRRIFATESYEPPPKESYFTEILYPALKDKDFLSQVYWWLKDNLSETFNPFMTAPMTDAKSSMIESAKSDLEVHYDDMANDPTVKDVVSYQRFVNYAKKNGYNWLEEEKGATLAILRSKALKCNGGIRIKIDGSPTTLYAIRNAEKWGAASTTILKQEYTVPWDL